MKIALEKIIEIVTREVIKELVKKGIEVEVSNLKQTNTTSEPVEIDMSEFKTPILTEKTFEKLISSVKEIIIPAKTVITPGARDIIKRNKIKVIYI